MTHYFRIFAAILTAAFCFTLTGCGGGSGTNSFTWFVDDIPANLDPQVASASQDVIACENLYGRLVRRNEDDEIVPDLCESWDISADGLTYTFHLKSGLTYAEKKGVGTDYAITADDFVFAFKRIFRADTKSPYAAEFSAINNSAAVLDGSLSADALGVSASGDLTLIFYLSEKDDSFLSKLTLSGAAPCDEVFFNSTRGKYGLSIDTTLSSGSFYIYNWTSSGLFLRRNTDANLVNNLRLVQNTTSTAQTAEELIANGRCSAALDDTLSDTSLRSINYSDTTWALLFNTQPEGSVLSSVEIRQALAGAVQNDASLADTSLYTVAEGLIPAGLSVDGIDYRSAVPAPAVTVSDPRALYLSIRQGMSASDFNGVTLLVSKESGLSSLAEQINSAWQKEFSLFFSIEEVSQEDFDKRISSGNYTIALAPICADGGSVYQMLYQFTAEGGGLTGLNNEEYASLLAQSTRVAGENRCRILAQCERMLLAEYTVVPLLNQQKRLLIDDGFNGLVFDPFIPVLDLTYTTVSK